MSARSAHRPTSPPATLPHLWSSPATTPCRRFMSRTPADMHPNDTRSAHCHAASANARAPTGWPVARLATWGAVEPRCKMARRLCGCAAPRDDSGMPRGEAVRSAAMRMDGGVRRVLDVATFSSAAPAPAVARPAPCLARSWLLLRNALSGLAAMWAINFAVPTPAMCSRRGSTPRGSVWRARSQAMAKRMDLASASAGAHDRSGLHRRERIVLHG